MFNKEKIIELLEEKGWSSYRLCKEAGMAQSTLSDILRGKNASPKTDTLQRIADALEVPISIFFDDGKEALSENITNIDSAIQRIARARKRMDTKDKEKMMKILEASFEDYFNEDEEDNEDED